jgi:hypothetical protein
MLYLFMTNINITVVSSDKTVLLKKVLCVILSSLLKI